MIKFIEKLHVDKYVNSYLILAIDMFISVGVTLFTLFLTGIAFSLFAYLNHIPYFLVASLIASAISFVGFNVHRTIIRHSTLKELWKIIVATIGKGVLVTIGFILVYGYEEYLSSHVVWVFGFDMLLTLVALIASRVVMIFIYEVIKDRTRKRGKYKSILVYGASSKSVAQITRLQNSTNYDVVGFISYGVAINNQMLSGKPVYYFENKNDFATICEEKGVGAILFATSEDAKHEEKRLLQYCIESNIKVLIRPAISEVVDGKIMTAPIREIKIEDLLGRDEIKISLDEIEANFKGKTVLVTGAAGSIGSELCRQLAGFGVKHLVLFDNAETPTHNIRLELEELWIFSISSISNKRVKHHFRFFPKDADAMCMYG